MRTEKRWEKILRSVAARPEIYGDEGQRRRLYEANKHKLPDSSNPNRSGSEITLDIPEFLLDKGEGLGLSRACCRCGGGLTIAWGFARPFILHWDERVVKALDGVKVAVIPAVGENPTVGLSYRIIVENR